MDQCRKVIMKQNVPNYRPDPVIRTVAKPDAPFVNDCVFPHPGPSCTNGTGINFEIFEIVMSTLGLNYTVERAEGTETGFFRDGRWHGMVGQLLRHEVDMTATLVSVTPERIACVDFSAPASFYSKGFLIQRPNAMDAAAVPTFLATPFPPAVWACFLVSLIAYVFLCFAARALLHHTGEWRPFRFFRDSVMDVIRSPLGQTEPRPYSAALRFTLNYLNVPMFFLMNFYTAALTGTLMFMSKPPDPFTGYDELARLVKDNKYTMVSMGNQIKFLPPLKNETVDESQPETIIRRASVYNPPFMAPNLEQVVRAVERNKSLVFWSSFNQVLEGASLSCDLIVIEDRFSMPTWLAFMFRKGDPLQAIISKTLYPDTSVESFMKRMFVKYTKHRRCPNADESADGRSSFFNLSLRHMQGAYFILLYGLALATPAFFAERFVRKMFRKKYRHTTTTIRRMSISPARSPTHLNRNLNRSRSLAVDGLVGRVRPDSSVLYGRSRLSTNAVSSVRRASSISFVVSSSPEISRSLSKVA